MKNGHGNVVYTQETETRGDQTNEKAMQGLALHANNMFKMHTGKQVK